MSRSRAAGAVAAAVLLACGASGAWPPTPVAASGARPPAVADRGDLRALREACAAALPAVTSRAARTDGDPSEAAGRAVASLRALDAALDAAGDLSARGARSRFEAALASRLRPRPPAAVLVTGYHEPSLAARRTRDDRFRYPLYAPPGRSPRPTRAAIEDGALEGRGLELFWVDDPIELYFLQVQGSGRLDLGGGRRIRVGYAGTNDRPYRSIGALLVERGAFASPADATAPAIKAWLRTHPEEGRALMRENERFVFFRVLDAVPGDAGPPGALGAPLVPDRSVAVDPAVVPLGSVGLLAVDLPDGSRFEQIVIAMDTGSAIRGPGRLDLFLGASARAADVAGLLRGEGEVAWLEASPSRQPRPGR